MLPSDGIRSCRKLVELVGVVTRVGFEVLLLSYRDWLPLTTFLFSRFPVQESSGSRNAKQEIITRR